MRLLIVICMLLQLPALAQDGTRFRELTFDEALAAAKEEGKLVFVDCYTSWCGPCKNMTEKVFPQKEAGDYFNPRFVCVKYDMEKGEGLELAKRFDVHAYPTFVIVRADGTVQHKLVGGSDLKAFIAQVEEGLDEKKNLLFLNEAYERGGMDTHQLMAYYSALTKAEEERADQVRSELWKKLTEQEKTTAEYWSLIANETSQPGTPEFDFMLGHLAELRQNVGRERVDEFVTNYYLDVLGNYILGYADKEAPAIDVLERQVPTLGVKRQKELERTAELAGLVARQEADKLAALIEERMNGWNGGTLRTYAFGFRGIAWGDKGKGTVPANYKELGKRLAALTVGKVEAEADTMTTAELREYLLALSGFGGELDDPTCQRLVNAAEKVTAREPDSQATEDVEYDLQEFRKQLNKNKQ